MTHHTGRPGTMGRVTAPLTPHGHHSPEPQPSPSSSGSDHAEDQSPPAPAGTILGELRRGALTALAVAVLGVALGLLWLWLAPRIPLISDGKAVYLKDTEGEEAAGGDGTFVLLGLGLGVLTAAVAFWRCRTGGVGVVVGLAAGALLGSVVGWRIGVWLGPTSDLVAHAKAIGPNKVFYGPLELRAMGSLLAWPIGATLTHLLLTSALGPRDPEPDTFPLWDDTPEAPEGPTDEQDQQDQKDRTQEPQGQHEQQEPQDEQQPVDLVKDRPADQSRDRS